MGSLDQLGRDTGPEVREKLFTRKKNPSTSSHKKHIRSPEVKQCHKSMRKRSISTDILELLLG
jgi:hypothetical protein